MKILKSWWKAALGKLKFKCRKPSWTSLEVSGGEYLNFLQIWNIFLQLKKFINSFSFFFIIFHKIFHLSRLVPDGFLIVLRIQSVFLKFHETRLNISLSSQLSRGRMKFSAINVSAARNLQSTNFQSLETDTDSASQQLKTNKNVLIKSRRLHSHECVSRGFLVIMQHKYLAKCIV